MEELFGSSRADSGVPVNAQTALTCSPWYRGIDLLSDSIAKSPCVVFRNLDDGKEVDRKHPWYRALFRKSGSNWTAFQFHKLMVAHLRSGGNAYAYIDREAYELLPVCPSRVSPVIDDKQKLWYVVDGSRRYNADEFLHFKGFGFDGLVGYSVVDKARESIGLSMGARLHQAKTLKNSARPGVLLKTPKVMSKPARDSLRNEWNAFHASGENAGRTAILDNGLDVSPYAFSSQDMELMKTQEFTIRDIANFMGVPPHKIGDVSRQGYNSLEQENLSFLGDTLEAILCNLEQELEDKLLTEDEKSEGSHEIMFDRGALSTTDTATKATYWRTALGGHPWAEVAEARRAFGLNHVEGTDVIPEPANMMRGGEQNGPKDSTGDFPKGDITITGPDYEVSANHA
jgi:HK97 family phage portal protein